MRKFRRFYQCVETELPLRATKKSAGYDFYAAMPVEIKPGEKRVIPTNIAVEMEQDEVLLLFRALVTALSLGLNLLTQSA